MTFKLWSSSSKNCCIERVLEYSSCSFHETGHCSYSSVYAGILKKEVPMLVMEWTSQ